MSRIPDRVKQRREYLKLKRMAGMKAMLAFAWLSLGIGFLVIAFGWLLHIVRLDAGVGTSIGAIVSLAVFLTVFNSFINRNWKRFRDQVDEVTLLQHSPPPQPEALPAEEVLVRGSEEPQREQGEVLVRPVIPKQETPAEQLLRVSDGEPQD